MRKPRLCTRVLGGDDIGRTRIMQSPDQIAAMTSIRQASPTDVCKLNLCNLDPLTENYARKFYFDYLVRWPTMFIVAENLKGQIVAYGRFDPTDDATSH